MKSKLAHVAGAPGAPISFTLEGNGECRRAPGEQGSSVRGGLQTCKSDCAASASCMAYEVGNACKLHSAPISHAGSDASGGTQCWIKDLGNPDTTFSMSVHGVNHAKLVGAAPLKDGSSLLEQFTVIMKRAVAKAVGLGISAENVRVTLQKGDNSVEVNATITPPAGVAPSEILPSLAPSMLASVAKDQLSVVPGFKSCMVGDMTINNFVLLRTQAKETPKRSTVPLVGGSFGVKSSEAAVLQSRSTAGRASPWTRDHLLAAVAASAGIAAVVAAWLRRTRLHQWEPISDETSRRMRLTWDVCF